METTQNQTEMENTSFDNFTVQEEDLTSAEILLVCIYFIIFTLGVIGNGLVIFVTGYKMKMTVNSIWFLNLSVADFVFILTLIVQIIWIFGTWHDAFANIVTFFLEIMTILNMFASIFFLTVISLDRCLCTWRIVWAQNKRTLGKAKVICVFVWLSSIGCSILFFIADLTEEDLVIYVFTVAFLIPFLIITSSYISVGVRLKRFKRVKFRPFWVILSVILVFFLCWFPYHVLSFCQVSASKNDWSESDQLLMLQVEPFLMCLCYLNSCLNPILYVFMCEEYKKKLKQSLLLVLETAFAEDHLALRVNTTSNPSRDVENTTSGL